MWGMCILHEKLRWAIWCNHLDDFAKLFLMAYSTLNASYFMRLQVLNEYFIGLSRAFLNIVEQYIFPFSYSSLKAAIAVWANFTRRNSKLLPWTKSYLSVHKTFTNERAALLISIKQTTFADYGDIKVLICMCWKCIFILSKVLYYRTSLSSNIRFVPINYIFYTFLIKVK